MTDPDEKDGNSIPPDSTPNTSKSSHSINDGSCTPVDSLSTSLTKACSMTPVEDNAPPSVSSSNSVRENLSSSNFLASGEAENRNESIPENKFRSQNLFSYGQKVSSTACANFYKLATSDLDSSEDLALPNLNELPRVSTSHNKVHLQPCANQRQLSADRTSSICYKISADSRDRQASCVDKGKKCLANVTTSSESGIYSTYGLGWQSSKHTVKQRLEYMYLNPYMADVYFVVSNSENTAKKRIPAHKFVLSIGSPVFDAMFKFDANQEETSQLNNAVQEIELIDVEKKALEALLIFLYTDKVSIYPDSVMAVLYTAKKYGIPALEQHCVDFLKYNLSPENAFMLLSQARLFDEPQLMDMCLAVIDRDTIEAIQAEGFTEVDHQTLCSVLKRDSLRIDELPLFQALVKWSMEECKENTCQ